MKYLKFWLSSALFVSLPAFAYIPEYGLIVSHAAEQHGKGSYLVEQEVTYRRDAEAYTVKETWIVSDEGNLRVTLEGRGPLKGLVGGTIIFEGGQKGFVDANSTQPHMQRLGEDWLEPMFYFRSSKYLRNRLVNLKIAPPDSLHDRASLPSDGEIKYEPPSFIRLSRVGGTTTWAISTMAGAPNAPTLWLEQDQFVLRKYRGPDQSVLRANDYAKYDEGLWFPRQRIYNFGNYTVETQTLRVKSLGKGKEEKFFKVSGLTSKEALRLPESDGLKEFYARFR